MNQTVTLLLFFLGSATPAERRALADYAARERLTLTSPIPSAPARTPPYAEREVRRIESALDEAQTLAASLDEERALAILDEVARDLEAHPELPQAAWLMAERHRMVAAIRRRQPDSAAEVAALLAAAAALEGDRAAAFGESTTVAAPPRLVAFNASDLDAADVLVLDGEPHAPGEKLAPGRHHARVLRDASLVWAGWLDVSARPYVELSLGVPPRVPCSTGDLAEVASGALRPMAPRGVRCEAWLGVRRARTGLEVARCRRDSCTAFTPLPRERPVAKPASLPTWATAAIVGVAALGAGSLLIFSGAFERETPPPRTVFVYEGPR